MKRVYTFLSIVVLMAFSFVGKAQTPAIPSNGPRIEFETTEHNFGTIYNMGKAECEFVFRNTGTATLVINNVRTSCGCTVPELESDNVAPGATGKIKVLYDPDNLGGFNKRISVSSNAVDNPRMVLRIKGNVIDGFHIEKRDGKWGVINNIEGVLAIPFVYDSLIFCKESECFVAIKDGRCGVINYSNQVIIPLIYQNITTYKRSEDRLMVYGNDGLINAKKNGRWGAIDKNGRVVIPFDYDESLWNMKYMRETGSPIFQIFNNAGHAKVKKNGKWGVIDKNNRVVETFK